ncbi:MAG: hypothetical protein C5B52_07270 [Bacteroidetes bacterium]|nr:MAG: hypothetical protein C5B52_07270 [Bacteroidota bacterium]
MKTFIAISLVIFSLALSSCSKKIIPDKPNLDKSHFKLDSLPQSEIDIPLQINLKPFYSLADKNVETIYASPGWPNDFVVENCDTRYMYRFKRGPFRITATGNVLNLNFTGTYIVAGAQRVCSGSGSNRVPVTPWTPTCTCGLKEGERRVEVGYKTTLNIKPNYTISANIERLEPKPLDKCTVCFWGQDITATVMQQIKERLDGAKAGILDSLNRLSLRPQMQQVWDMLNTSLKVYNMGYLQVNPEKIRVSTFFAKNDSLNLSIGVSARPLISLSKPEDHRTVVPDISDNRQRCGFNIFIDAIMDYDSLSNILNAQFAGKRIDLEKMGKYVIVEKCDLYGVDNEKLIIKIQFSGSDKGNIYLTAKPVFNKEKSELELHDLDFDIKTKDLLVKTAKWLFNRRILNELNKYSKFNTAEYASSFLTRINEMMNREIVSGVSSNGKVDSLQVLEIYPFAEHLIVRCKVSGQLSVRISSLK